MNLHRIIMAAAGALCLQAAFAARPAINFISTDSALNATFEWARDMAMSYVHDSGDPVGPWYEAALPGRYSFCMRDLAHQAVAGHLLGLDEHNRNMTGRIASNVSESKDWCSYWETERLDRPTPCDYANDKEFWYNLPANFDMMRACRDLYEWTGDADYLIHPDYVNFYCRTAHDYADRWALTPDSIMSRRRYMNTPVPFNPKNGFHTCRGLPSYAENFSGITVAVDLVGAARKGYEAYADLRRLSGDSSREADFGRRRAGEYAELMENVWWDDSMKRYNTYYKEDGSFHRGEGIPYLLLIDAVDHPAQAVADVLSRDWNVENLSAFPYFLYRNGYDEKAYAILTSLPSVKRSDYPEVSFGAIEGIFRGLMGIEASASRGTVATCHRGTDDVEDRATDVPVAGGVIDVTHKGGSSSEFTNRTGRTLKWEASFIGDHTTLYCNGRKVKSRLSHDAAGHPVSTAVVKVKPGQTVEISVNK